jgi:Mrp family chromosome partitioning ATPase
MANENKCGFEGQQDQYQLQNKEINERLTRIKNKILVMSGKGGVGKSSIASYLSVALAKKGYKVGLMDVDLLLKVSPQALGLTVLAHFLLELLQDLPDVFYLFPSLFNRTFVVYDEISTFHLFVNG